MVKRNWIAPKEEECFFPVKRIPLYFADQEKKLHTAKRFYGILDVKRNEVISTVSDHYSLIANEKAYKMAENIVRNVFADTRLEDMQFFNLIQPRTRSFMLLDLIRTNTPINPFSNDSWIAFLRIKNSFNRMYALTYEIGFCRWICLNGVIFGSKSIKISLDHTKKAPLLSENIQHRIGQIQDLEKKFNADLQRLRKFEITERTMKEIFCMIFPVEHTTVKEKLSQTKCENLLDKKNRMESLVKDYTNEMGTNAYALLNILSDYASFPQNDSQNRFLAGCYQKKVGDWMNDFQQTVIGGKKTLENYVTQDAKDALTYLLDEKKVEASTGMKD